jgi:hypothetical protein
MMEPTTEASRAVAEDAIMRLITTILTVSNENEVAT